MDINVVSYEFVYNEKGKQKKYPVKISFIANGVRDRYGEILKTIGRTKDVFQSMTDILNKKGEMIASTNKSNKTIDDLKEDFVKLDEEYKELQTELEAIGKSDFFNERRDIIKLILEDNGYSDALIQDDKFWKDRVYPESMNNFLNSVVYKDYDLTDAVKKKTK